MNSMEDKKMNIGRFDMYYEEFENVKDGQYVIFADCANGQLLLAKLIGAVLMIWIMLLLSEMHILLNMG